MSLTTEGGSRLLPVELDTFISQFCTRETLAKLSVVSRSWHQSVEATLYRNVQVVWGMRSSVMFHAGLRLLWQVAQNPRRAALVHTLDASQQGGSDRWEPNCEKCDPDQYFGPCNATTAPYPTDLLRDLTEYASTSRVDEVPRVLGRVNGDFIARIWAAASRKTVACLHAQDDNRLVFWSHFYLAVRACTNLRGVRFPVGHFSPAITSHCMGLLVEPTHHRYLRVLQVPPAILDNPIAGRPLRQANRGSAAGAFVPDFLARYPFVLVVDRGEDSRPNDQSPVSPFAGADISVIVVCARGAWENVDLIPAFYGRLESKSMDAYFQDVGAYLDWRKELTFEKSPEWRVNMWVKFHPSQLPRGLELLVPVLRNLGTSLALLVIQATDRVELHDTSRTSSHVGPSITADVVARAIHPLQDLEFLGIQNAGGVSKFSFTTEELADAVRAIGMPTHLEVLVE